MKFIQPYIDPRSPVSVASADRVACPVPVYFVRYRYPHHAAPSGYDRLSEFVGEPVRLSRGMYWLGESVLRVPAKLISWYGSNFEYSRHDFVMECQTLAHMMRHCGCVYHFLYGEKSFKLLAGMSGRRGHRLVASLHHFRERYPRLFRSTDHLRRLDHVIALSTDQAAFLEDIVGKGRVTFVPHGIDTGYFTPCDRSEEDRPPRCVFAGTHMRDFGTLERVVEEVARVRPDVEFHLLSASKLCEPIASLPNVRWMGRTTDTVYLDTLRGADILLLPLKNSVAVNVVLEAFACGVPVVTNRGGISDYLDDSCAVALEPGDAEGMAAAVVSLLADEALRRSMSVAARQHALKFDWPVIAERMAAVYAAVASGTEA